MKAFIAKEPGKAEFVDVKKPEVGPGEILAKVAYAGICATDIALITGETTFVREGLAKYPIRIGHEWAGVVTEVGADVKTIRPGDHVSSISENTTLAALKKICRAGFVNRREENSVAAQYVETLKTKTPGTKALVLNLSGGNQQKVVLAKWLYTDAEVLILDEPTRGIDVGAKYEIYQLINQLADSGKAIIIISSEMPEVISMSDRLLVIHDGKCKGELTGDQKTGENIMKYAILEEDA